MVSMEIEMIRIEEIMGGLGYVYIIKQLNPFHLKFSLTQIDFLNLQRKKREKGGKREKKEILYNFQSHLSIC